MARMKKKRIRERKAKENAKKWKMDDRGDINPEDIESLVKELLSVEGARYEEIDGKITVYHPGDEETPNPHFHVIG
jgi:hypothetical protein